MTQTFLPHDRRQYEFSRGITDGVHIEKSEPPIESWGSGIVHCIAFVGLVILAWLIAANIAQALQ